MLLFILASLHLGHDDFTFVGEDGKCCYYYLSDISSNIQTGEWSTSDLNSIVNEVSSKFSIDASSLVNYFNVVRYSTKTKRAFTKFGFKGAYYTLRDTFLSTTIIKVTKNNGIYIVNGRQASVKGQAGVGYWEEVCFDTIKNLDGKKINEYYSIMEEIIRDDIETFKQI